MGVIMRLSTSPSSTLLVSSILLNARLAVSAGPIGTESTGRDRPCSSILRRMSCSARRTSCNLLESSVIVRVGVRGSGRRDSLGDMSPWGAFSLTGAEASTVSLGPEPGIFFVLSSSDRGGSFPSGGEMMTCCSLQRSEQMMSLTQLLCRIFQCQCPGCPGRSISLVFREQI